MAVLLDSQHSIVWYSLKDKDVFLMHSGILGYKEIDRQFSRICR